jgi:hypothetical protein
MKKNVKFVPIHLGTLNFDLIAYKIKQSNDRVYSIKAKEKSQRVKDTYTDFVHFFVKITHHKIEYELTYACFLHERNSFYILFTEMVGHVVEVAVMYEFEKKLLSYFIFYEILVRRFFDFMTRVLNEIQVFESYLYQQNCIIPNAMIRSINITILKNLPDKASIKYI